jgi:hypothetical protein
MASFQADTGQIDDAASRMGKVAAALELDYGGVDPSALGFPSAQGALAQFIASWTSGADNLSKGVTSIQKGLSKVASNYSLAEAKNTIRKSPGSQ